MASETLTIIDNRTGRQYEIPIRNGAIKATNLVQIKVSEDDGLITYDPGFMNTASCQSKITYIDGDKGILRYRGYPIEQLAEKSTYLETAYLILHGELPTQSQLAGWTHNITYHSIIHENIKKLIDGFHHDAHPMGILVSTVGALSTFYPEAKKIFDANSRKAQTYRLISKMPTLAAFAYRHSLGLPYSYPDNDLSYSGNFLNMLFKITELKYQPHPVLDIALELERIALQDDYFIKRKLYPNVDFYSGLIYQSMGLPMDMFPVLFAIPRTSGWIAQWEEMLTDPDQKLARPKQVYLGPEVRDYVPMEKRK